MRKDNLSSSTHFTRGGQIIFHNWRMLLQVNNQVMKLFFGGLLLLTPIIFCMETTSDAFWLWIAFLKAKACSVLGFEQSFIHIALDEGEYQLMARTVLEESTVSEALTILFGNLVKSFAISSLISCVFSFFFVVWLRRKGKKQTEDRFIRGSKIEEPKILAKRIRKEQLASDIEISHFPLVKDSEVQHFLIHGTTGAGKGVTISEFLDAIRARGDRAIIYDKGCTFMEYFFREGEDTLLNPFDRRSAYWNLWTEAQTLPELENIAEALIPVHGSSDPFWANAARSIFVAAAYKIKDDPAPSLQDLYEVLVSLDLSLLREFLEGTDAAALVSEKNEKTSMSIRTMLSTYLKSFRFLLEMPSKDGAAFSIKNWMQSDHNHWLFVSSNAEQHESVKPLISMWLATASTALLSMPEDRERRIWFIMDELPSLHKIPHLPETIAEARKFGGCFVLGMQSFAQLEAVYGIHIAKSIFDLLNTRFFFRSPSSDMAKLVSRELGEQEIEDAKENYSYGANTIRDGVSLGRQTITRPIITYPEIMAMENLKCFLKLPGEYPIVPLRLEPKEREKRCVGFDSSRLSLYGLGKTDCVR